MTAPTVIPCSCDTPLELVLRWGEGGYGDRSYRWMHADGSTPSDHAPWPRPRAPKTPATGGPPTVAGPPLELPAAANEREAPRAVAGLSQREPFEGAATAVGSARGVADRPAADQEAVPSVPFGVQRGARPHRSAAGPSRRVRTVAVRAFAAGLLLGFPSAAAAQLVLNPLQTWLLMGAALIGVGVLLLTARTRLPGDHGGAPYEGAILVGAIAIIALCALGAIFGGDAAITEIKGW